MKKMLLFFILLLSVGLLASGCGNNKAENDGNGKKILRVGASPVPHTEILNEIKPVLAKEGIDLQIVEMSDYVQPNMALADKELDANFFQHLPYLDKFCKDRNLQLVSVAAVHIEPMGVYSKQMRDLKELANGAIVAIPNDPTNCGRALMLLEKAGLIKLKDGAGINATVGDVVDNPRKLQFVELEAPQLPRALEDVAVAVINTNYAMEAKLVPTKDALAMEQKDSPYANILVVRKGDENREDIKKLVAALQSAEVKKFIDEKYKGAIVPAF